MVAWAVPLVLAWLAVDYGVGLVQLHQKQQKQAERDALERTAMFRLRADVADIAYGPAGSYQLVLYAENRSPDEPLYLMAPSLQVFVQVGNLWKEVPARSTDDREGRVLQISSRQTFQFSFTPDVTSFEQLLPGYMHVRFRSTLLVSQSGEPKGDLVERVDDYYVHLKPHGASDEEILRKNRFPGKPPLWIPMPPH